MVGIATLMMLMSSTDMNMPTISTASGTPQPRSDGGGAGAAGAGGAGAAAARNVTVDDRSSGDRSGRGVGGHFPSVTRRHESDGSRADPTVDHRCDAAHTAGHGLRRSAYIGH